MSIGSKESKTNTTNETYDQRVVNDASAGGFVVNGTGNNVTDGGAFEIVSKLADQIANVSALQTTVARDIALRDTSAGVAYANAAMLAQEAAAKEGDSFTFNKAHAALAAAALVAVYLLWRSK